MPADHPARLALLVRRPPYDHRVARAEADLALAAAALDFELCVYFMGNSMLQLVVQRAPANALLPAGYRAWAALPKLGNTRIFVESRWWKFCQAANLELVVPVEVLEADEMKRTWRDCQHVLVL